MTFNFGGSFGIVFGFASSDRGAGTLYPVGYYDFEAGNDDFSAGATYGTANSPYGGKVALILGADAVDDITIRISGTSWAPSTGTRTAADTEDISIPDGSVQDDYFQSNKKWIGQVSITLIAGTAKVCNYGFVDYWTCNNRRFWLRSFKATGVGDVDDASADVIFRHHKTTGWTYGAGGPTAPAPIAQMTTDYSTESDVKNDEQFSYARKGLAEDIAGNNDEGLVVEVVQGVGLPFVDGNISMCIGMTPQS